MFFCLGGVGIVHTALRKRCTNWRVTAFPSLRPRILLSKCPPRSKPSLMSLSWCSASSSQTTCWRSSGPKPGGGSTRASARCTSSPSTRGVRLCIMPFRWVHYSGVRMIKLEDPSVAAPWHRSNPTLDLSLYHLLLPIILCCQALWGSEGILGAGRPGASLPADAEHEEDGSVCEEGLPTGKHLDLPQRFAGTILQFPSQHSCPKLILNAHIPFVFLCPLSLCRALTARSF